MKTHHPLRPLLLTALVAAVEMTLIVLQVPAPAPANAQTLQATESMKWYRGNLHTHSLWSDGDDYLEAIALWYREHHYDFLGFTDHNILADKERWIDVEKSKGKQIAFDKLKQFADIGLIVSIFQALTQINENTLTFVPKMIVIAIILVLAGPWMMDTMKVYTVNLFDNVSTIVRGP